jgi:hypothetical protein
MYVSIPQGYNEKDRKIRAEHGAIRERGIPEKSIKVLFYMH